MSESGYSGTPLPKKLGLKPELAALFVGLPQHLQQLAIDLPQADQAPSLEDAVATDLDYLHVFETERAALQDHALRLKAMLKTTGMFWISWPKTASNVATTITEDLLRSIFLPTGLVDVKVCAIDEVWSGLKLMIRKDMRG
jgi:hypothetical protein